jgi:broad specificity phosphatase PhoE
VTGARADRMSRTDMTAEKRIFLARHGQTFHNAAAGESYVAGDQLSELGWEQGRRLGRFLEGRGVRRIVTSPLDRARQTAEGVNEALRCTIEDDERLIEIVPPGSAGPGHEEEAEHWSAYMARHAEDRDFSLAGAESFNAVMQRVRGAVERFEASDATLFVSHAGFMRFIMGYVTWGEEFSPATLPRLWVFEVHNAGLSELRHVGERPGYERSEGWSIVTWMQYDYLTRA